jgi:hypothetical protein
MILALGAMVLLSMVIINFNKTSMSTDDVMYDSNFGITASSIAASVIEDATKKRFDNIFYIDSSTVYDVNFFTPANELGIESSQGEILTDPFTFNDFDDYKGYSTVDSTMPTAIFDILCDVNYVEALAPDVPVNHQTWHKKITVKVSSKFMRDTIMMSSIYSYWTE